jgi:hypothetical protein
MCPNNAIPDLEGFSGCILSATDAQLHYPSDGLVPLNIWQRALDGQFTTLLVHIGPTNACHLHFDQNGPGFYFWN